MASEAEQLDPYDDFFHPPAIPTLVHCIHCHEEYESYLIEWRECLDEKGVRRGFWCCPIPECDGAGFGFDIFPLDPDYEDERGKFVFDSEEEDEALEDEFDEFEEDDELYPPMTECDELPEDFDASDRPGRRPFDVDDDIPF